ncbi:hypothetical protein JCM15519_03810 [Fundidesulfovibrio butyratiphilus]
MSTITVKARPGVAVPMEGAPRRHITESAPRIVPASAYYLRRLADGDLVAADAAPAPDMTPALDTEE